jgi:phage replication O-like protein O
MNQETSSPKFTQCPNEQLEKLAILGLNGSQLSIALLVMRQTYGFHKTEDKISISWLINKIGKSRPTVTRETKQLVKKMILVKKSILGKTSILSINPNVGQWLSASKETDTSKENDSKLVKKTLPTKERKINKEEENILDKPEAISANAFSILEGIR